LGYYTVSEERQGIPAHLYYYPRISSILTTETITFSYQLHQNYPNPFNQSTTIEFDLPKTSEVTLQIFNILGEEVATLLSARLTGAAGQASLLSGSHSVEWDAAHLASGVYLYRLEAEGYVETKKMILMK
jgi:hypothetical protein